MAKYKRFASRLKQLLAEREMSQRQFALSTGVTSGSISDYLKGTRAPSALALACFARVLGTSMEYLWGEGDQAPSNPYVAQKRKTEIESYLKGLSSELRSLQKKIDSTLAKVAEM